MSNEAVGEPWFRAVLGAVGAATQHVAPLAGGSVNHTHRVERVDASPIVLRFPVDPLREDEFPVEAWAAAEAAQVGIPVAAPVLHGVEAGIPFAISEYVEPDPRPIEQPWAWLGRYAVAVGTIPLDRAPVSLYSRFGPDLRQAWAAHLDYNLAALVEDDPLRRDGAYASAADVRSLLEPLTREEVEFGLAHGDLAPRNLISRGPDEPPVLIDWGAAETGPTPWTDARRVFRWAFVDGSITRQEYDAFVASAGLGSDAARRTLAAMTALHLVDVTRWARDRRPDLYDEYLSQCRAGIGRIREEVGGG
ncbi:phosphotransferase [Curtobacterium sp. NPDC090217]|uniref:phosphotransferase n=1 Tax=Curtobacterium sp. NPDC090217 TaxID=3363970 RepID=UPI0038161DAA